ncbi:MAG TPA: MBL fold metallo-hydrolase [Candidatus Hydrogenedentes bacterium]|nr:MBL fold metallo-hydrolase [Candidatus Hydrogenedentota bacterium]
MGVATPDKVPIAVDCHYMGIARRAAAYLLIEDGRAALVDNNTNRAVPLLLDALAASDLAPDAVEYVIVTHVHLDHAGGTAALLKHCPNATVLAHPRAARHLVDPSRLVAGAKGVYGEETFAKLYGVIEGVPEARVRTFDDGESLAWGTRTLRFLHTRGHANHHFCIHDSGANCVLAGDAFGIGRSSCERQGPSFLIAATAPTDFDPALARDAVRRIVETGAASVYVTHYGRFDEVGEDAEKLIRCIDLHEAIVDAAVEQRLEGGDLYAFCLEQTSAALDEHLRWCGVLDFEGDRCFVEGDIALNAMGLAHVARKRIETG